MKLILDSPAKLNLFLHITSRRKDGYHQLQTLFQLLDFNDEISFEQRDDKKIELSSNLTLKAADNLIVKAANALQTLANCQFGATIHLKKRIPLGGGLGGGSSNAATTLLALNALWHTALSDEKLAQLGLQLGADVPVFMMGETAWAEGIGEQLTPVDLPEAWFVILTPPCHVSTAEIFADENLPRNTARINFQQFQSEESHNDCENLVKKRYPEVAEALDWLNQHAPARLTGTGSCVFAKCNNEQHARELAESAPSVYRAIAAKGQKTSTVHDKIAHFTKKNQ